MVEKVQIILHVFFLDIHSWTLAKPIILQFSKHTTSIYSVTPSIIVEAL